MVIGDSDPLVNRLGVSKMICRLDALSCAAIFGTGCQRGERRKRREESSCDQQDFVAHKVEANSLWPRPIKEERGCRLQHVLAQFVPGVTFGEDALRKAFGAIPAIGLLNDFEHQFTHKFIIRHALASAGKPQCAPRHGSRVLPVFSSERRGRRWLLRRRGGAPFGFGQRQGDAALVITLVGRRRRERR
jgi:hypothetical protein